MCGGASMGWTKCFLLPSGGLLEPTTTIATSRCVRNPNFLSSQCDPLIIAVELDDDQLVEFCEGNAIPPVENASYMTGFVA